MPNDSVPAGTLFGDVSINPQNPKPGESVLVNVQPPTGQLWGVNSPRIRINGIMGAKQYLQFSRGGTRTLHIVAELDGQIERRTVDVQVQSLVKLTLGNVTADSIGRNEKKLLRRAVSNLPILQVGQFATEPYKVGLAVSGFRVFSEGMANERPHHKKTLEPELRDFLRRVDLVSSAGFGGTISSPVSTPSRVERMPITMRTIRDQFSRLRLVPAEAKLLRTKNDRVLGAFQLHKPIVAAALQPLLPRPDVTKYHWDFGDGNRITSTDSRVDHDYRPSLDPELEHQQFDVTLRIQRPDGTVEEVRRTLSVHNAYAICRRRGTLVPHVEQHTFAHAEGLGFRGQFRIFNVENYEIRLTGRRLRVMSSDHDQPDTIGALTAIDPISIPAKGSRNESIFLTFNQVPRDSLGFAIYFFGNTDDGKPIRVEVQFDIPARDRASRAVRFGEIAIGRLPVIRDLLDFVQTENSTAVNDSLLETPAVLRQLLAVNPSAMESTVEDRNRHVLGPRTEHLRRPLLREMRRVSAERLLSHTAAPPPAEGHECDPDNLPELTPQQSDEGWVCQSTAETREVVTPARFLNALKGDIILSPGGNGLIGGLLMQVSPPQRYSHCGIMTRNYDQITHSTASEGRLLDHLNGSVLGEPAPTDGFTPNILKYQWPGVITQTIEQAVYGEELTDPDFPDKRYKVMGFGSSASGADVDGHWEIVPPLVVKPDPLIETPEIRAKLRQVANDAMSQTGNSHYRFFCYTDPTLGQRPEGIAPASSGWAAGTYPTVCSSFLWMTLKRQGVHLESANATVSPSDLESLDVAAGAQIGNATPDGLYLYTAAERQAAAHWLKTELAMRVARKLEEDAGILSGTVDLFSDMIDDVSNQVINTFASDWADTAAKDSEDWKSTQDSNAISPDNILLWDSPGAIGLYGFAAPLVFRPSRLEEVVIHNWRKVPTKGNLRGRVWYRGAPVAGAFVQVFDGKTDYTNASGEYEILAIPFGNYSVKAQKDNIQGITASTTLSLNLSQAEQSLDITLQPPVDVNRRVQIQLRMQTTDDENWPSDDEHADTSYFREVFVQPWHSHEEIYFEQRMGGEVRIELRLFIDLNLDRSINVNLNAKMYEGTSEDTGDLEDEQNTTGFRVGKDEARSGNIRLYNNETDGGDVSNISFIITNLVQP
jgi:hypothetical protein